MNIKGMYQARIKKIMNIFNSPEELYFANIKRLNSSGILSEEDIYNITESKRTYSFDGEIERLFKLNTHFISVDNVEYPDKLRHIYDYPYGIFVRGNVILNKVTPAIAIVGARNCSNYGKEVAKVFAKELAMNGISIISGLAKGIDVHSHEGAILANGITIGVLGCGVDICYPSENIDIFTDIQKKGAVISEYPPGINPAQWQFPARNRIISALADGVLIIEARKKSGSLITAEYALEQGKDIYAIPGRVGDKLSEGCNALIKAGAQLVLRPEDILEDLSDNYQFNIKFSEKKEYSIAKDLEVVYSKLDLFPKSIHNIIEETGEQSEVVFEKILKLQLLNMINEPVKGYYCKKIR